MIPLELAPEHRTWIAGSPGPLYTRLGRRATPTGRVRCASDGGTPSVAGHTEWPDTPVRDGNSRKGLRAHAAKRPFRGSFHVGPRPDAEHRGRPAAGLLRLR